MWMIMCSPLVSTLVTRWAFKRSCFLINVSMSTSVLFSGCVETAMKGYIGIEVPFFSSLGLGALKALSSDYTFGIGTLNRASPSSRKRVGRTLSILRNIAAGVASAVSQGTQTRYRRVSIRRDFAHLF